MHPTLEATGKHDDVLLRPRFATQAEFLPGVGV